jgi:hypothetical protein
LDFLSGLKIFNGTSFIIYGLLCLNSLFLKNEFKRWGVEKFRKLTGWLELLGGVGQFVGLGFAPIGVISSLGLFLLMFFGSMIRFKHGDSAFQSAPAIIYCLLNGFLIYSSL